MATKMTKRELQGPDKFQEEAGGIFEWAHNHPREVAMAGAGLVAIVFVIGLTFGDGRGSVDPEAGADLAAALELVDRPVGGAAAEGAEPPFASEAEKQQAIAQALEGVRKEHGGTSTAIAATLPLADAKFKLAQYDEALALYDEYLKKAPKEAQLRFLALEGRAQTLEAQGKDDEAVQAWDRLAKEAPTYADRALFGKGRLLEKQEKWDEARAAYQQIQKEHAEGAMARLASERLTELDRSHPAAAAAAATEGK